MRAVGALKPASAFRRPEPSPLSGVLAIGAMLLLAACSSSSPVVSSEPPAAANERADAATARADAAEARLADLRESLAAAQAALAQGAGGEQRSAARAAVSDARGDLAKVRTDLAAQPASAAKTAAEAALAAVDTALARTAEALAATDPAAVSGPGWFTSADVRAMHTSLDEALIALDGALAALKEALNVATSALRTLLAQAQAVLSTAQISLIPLLREELAEAEAAAQRARADAYDPLVSLAQALEPRAPGFAPRGGAEITRTPRDAEKPLHIRTEAVAFVAGKRLDRMRNADGRPEELGTYELWLSNYGGLDRGANADDAGDDTHRYLEYAAYGLFMFFDNVRRTPSFSRPQAFALGYDAFRDAAGVRTTDVSTSIAATFQGHTMARELVNSGAQSEITLNRALPLRGEVMLNACIGGSGCTGDGIPATANRISGMITSLEELRHDGEWISYLPAAGGIPMAEGAIAADGSFGGQLDHPRTAGGAPNTRQFDADISPTSFNTSRYGGNLYGPRNGLEAAGWWHMQVTAPQTPNGALIGSFGARCTEGCAPAN